MRADKPDSDTEDASMSCSSDLESDGMLRCPCACSSSSCSSSGQTGLRFGAFSQLPPHGSTAAMGAAGCDRPAQLSFSFGSSLQQLGPASQPSGSASASVLDPSVLPNSTNEEMLVAAVLAREAH